MSCELLKSKDIGELPILFRDNLKDCYEDIIMNNTLDFQPLDDFIESLVKGIWAAEAQGQSVITLHPTKVLGVLQDVRVAFAAGIRYFGEGFEPCRYGVCIPGICVVPFCSGGKGL